MPNIHSDNSEGTAFRFQRSEAVQEIVSSKPGFLIRYGILFFFITILLLILACWFIEYPDIVTGKAKLTSINTPKEVVTKTAGKLIRLFAKEGEQTTIGSILGFMESNASHEEIISLSANMDTIEYLVNKNEIEKFLPYLNSSYSNLGELQQSYQIFLQSFTGFRNYISGGFYLIKKSLLSKDITFIKKMHENLLIQKALNIEDIELSQKTYTANESLKVDKVISDFDYRNEKSKFINKKLSLPQIEAGIIKNESEQNEKIKEIIELDNTISQQKSIFLQALNTFKSQIDDWKKRFILIAPIDGKISFATFLQENQQLQANETICFINPENTEYYAEIFIPQANFGKVKQGQEVLLKFPSYPFQEYGSMKGRISFISKLGTQNGYLAKVTLPNSLITTYKKQIQFRDGLEAQGEIITHSMRLLQRFYYNIIKQVRKE